MGQNRLNLPNGAESTCLERPGRVEPQEENPHAVLLFQTIYGQFNVPAAPSEYRNLTDFETVKECSSRRQSLVFEPILPSRLFIEMLSNGELNF